MKQVVEFSGQQLANALRALDVNFILGGQSSKGTLHKQPARLIAALARSNESRLRLSLIPLFLEHPEFGVHVQTVAKELDPIARLTLQCYYTASIWLAKKHKPQILLTDYFSQELNLDPVGSPEENLQALARRHKALSGTSVNWLGTYLHAAQVWQKGLEFRQV